MPNVMVALVDVTRFDSFGFANQFNNTPFLSELAARAAYFPNTVTPDTWTPASHAAFFTNRAPMLRIDEDKKIVTDWETEYFGLPGYLKMNEYETLAVVDNSYLMRVLFSMRDFDKLQLFKSQDALDDKRALKLYTITRAAHGYGTKLTRNDESQLPRWKQLIDLYADVKEDDIKWLSVEDYYRSDDYFNWRYQYLKEYFAKRDRSVPYFLFLNLQGWIPQMKYRETMQSWFRDFHKLNFGTEPTDVEATTFSRFFLDFKLFYEDVNSKVRMPTVMGKIHARLYAEYCDVILEDMYEYLLREGHFSEADVLVVSTDHGHSWREHDLGFYAHGYEYRPYQEIVRAPMIIVAPRYLAPGTYEAAVSLLDVFPTIASWISEGEEVAPSLFNPLYALPLEKRIRSNTPISLKTAMGTEVVYHDGFKFFQNEERGMKRLFNLKDDATEQNDLAGDPAFKDVAIQMADFCQKRDEYEARSVEAARVIRGFHAFSEVKAIGSARDLEENREALRALGYIE